MNAINARTARDPVVSYYRGSQPPPGSPKEVGVESPPLPEHGEIGCLSVVAPASEPSVDQDNEDPDDVLLEAALEELAQELSFPYIVRMGASHVIVGCGRVETGATILSYGWILPPFREFKAMQRRLHLRRKAAKQAGVAVAVHLVPARDGNVIDIRHSSWIDGARPATLKVDRFSVVLDGSRRGWTRIPASPAP